MGLTSLNPDDEGSDDTTLLKEPSMLFELRNNAYDNILDVYPDDSNIEDSWLVLCSKMFNTIHIVKLGDAYKEAQNSNRERNILGGTFYESDEDILLRLQPTDDPIFWNNIDVVFSEDGKKVTVNTHHETYMIVLDKDSKDYRYQFSIDYLKNKIVIPFRRGTQGDFLFCQRLQDIQKFQFSSLHHESPLSFSNTVLDAAGENIKVVEAMELEREDEDGKNEKFLRVTAIRDHEEVICWEVIANSRGFVHCSSVNS